MEGCSYIYMYTVVYIRNFSNAVATGPVLIGMLLSYFTQVIYV